MLSWSTPLGVAKAGWRRAKTRPGWPVGGRRGCRALARLARRLGRVGSTEEHRTPPEGPDHATPVWIVPYCTWPGSSW